MNAKSEDTISVNQADQTGLTKCHKVALSRAWKILKINKKFHAYNISVQLFEKYPEFLTHFEATPPDNKNLHMYMITQLEGYGKLIEEGLWDISLFEENMHKIIKMHKRIAFSEEDMKKMANVAKDYLLEVLVKQSTKTFKESLIFLFRRLILSFENELL